MFKKLPPSITALLLQAITFLIVAFSFSIGHFQANPLVFVFICGVVAAALGHLCGLARWWLAIQLFFAPAVLLMLSLHIPSGFYLAAFLVMLLVYWSTFHSQVPLYLSSRRVWKTLEELLPAPDANSKFKFMDIGSGMGGVLAYLAEVRPDGEYYGVENAPLPFYLSRLRIKLGNHANCHIRWESLWECDLAPYDVVFAYLSPVPMAQLWSKVKHEMRPGSLFISNSFAVPENPPQYSITLDDMHRSTLHIWHM